MAHKNSTKGVEVNYYEAKWKNINLGHIKYSTIQSGFDDRLIKTQKDTFYQNKDDSYLQIAPTKKKQNMSSLSYLLSKSPVEPSFAWTNLPLEDSTRIISPLLKASKLNQNHKFKNKNEARNVKMSTNGYDTDDYEDFSENAIDKFLKEHDKRLQEEIQEKEQEVKRQDIKELNPKLQSIYFYKSYHFEARRELKLNFLKNSTNKTLITLSIKEQEKKVSWNQIKRERLLEWQLQDPFQHYYLEKKEKRGNINEKFEFDESSFTFY